jgi:hypothetical protein
VRTVLSACLPGGDIGTVRQWWRPGANAAAPFVR